MSAELTQRLTAMPSRIADVEDRIVTACQKARRPREDVLLLAVTKTFPAEIVQEAYAAGMRHFGENYVQEFQAKRPLLVGLEGARYHLIGHLQSNKAAVASGLFDTIQTVDSAKLAQRLNAARQMLDVFLEVHLGGESSKSGAAPAEIPALIDAVRACPHLRLQGLMTIPPWSENAEISRPYFVQLRELAVKHRLAKLSMGMSNDFEVAIEEGATHIRVGTALFGRRSRKP